MDITYSEKLWLLSRGGRDETDVYEDERGKFVVMGNYQGLDVKVYVPSDFVWKGGSPFSIRSHHGVGQPQRDEKENELE